MNTLSAETFSVPIEDYGDASFQMTPFEGMDEIRVAFRIAGEGMDEHYLNRYAASLTTTRFGEKSDLSLRNSTNRPYGRMCHTELMMQIQPKVWTRHSIYLGTFDPETNTIEPGKAHIKLVDDDEISQKYIPNEKKTYEIISLYVNRKDQLKGLKFLTAQNQAPFNKDAYYYNLIPLFNFGTSQYTPELNHQIRPWYCTELVVCALQAMAPDASSRRDKLWKQAVWNIRANHSSPNELYRTLKNTNEMKNAIFTCTDRQLIML